MAIAFSPDSRLIAAGTDRGGLRLWDFRPEQGSVVDLSKAPELPEGEIDLDQLDESALSNKLAIWAVAFSADGNWLATGNEDRLVRIWDLRRKEKEPLILQGHASSVASVAFSADGNWLASGSRDGTVRLWNVSQPELSPVVLRSQNRAIFAMVFSKQGKNIITGSEDGHILLRIASTETLADAVCQRVRRNLTLDEWRQFVGADIEYERTCPKSASR